MKTLRSLHHFTACATVLLLATFTSSPVAAQSEDLPETGGGRRKLRLQIEAKANVRHSKNVEFQLKAPFPPEFIPPGQDAVFLRTPDPGTSLEISTVAFIAEYDFSPHIMGRAKVDVLDLYNRNPTSVQDRIFVREAWLRVGADPGPLKPMSGTSFHALFGLAPRFTKQIRRNLESYGLWGTAFGRFEQMQLRVGGTVGSHVYWKAHVANRNPLFFRDPNALAGDNGTPERVPGNVDPIFQSGFPILYDTLTSDVNLSGEFEYGGGVGVRFLADDERDGVDVLGWGFHGKLAEDVSIRGTFYGGDLDLLDAPFAPLPVSSDEKTDLGVNVHGRTGRLRLFGQFVSQDIAGLKRRGIEAEASYFLPLDGLFASGDRPVMNWLRLTFRFSNIDNDFQTPAGFVAPSLGWDWRKYDFGARLGIVRDLDLTVEYARHDMITAGGARHPDEFLLTLRWAMKN